MIELVLGPPVVSVETRVDPRDAFLFAEEEEVVARAVADRRREFTTVRYCARRALAALGEPSVPLLPGRHGATLWPAGVVGSMTHCNGYRAAAVARAEDVLTLGIDAEPAEDLPAEVLDLVASPSEQEHLRGLLADRTAVKWDRLLFSAKESTYKAWFPLVRSWLGFEDAEVTFHAADQMFEVRLLVPGPEINGIPLTGFHGRWAVADGLLVTAIAVLRTRSPTHR